MNERDRWASRMGLVLAMAGNAIGLGNFLRFPRLAAQYGGGALLDPVSGGAAAVGYSAHVGRIGPWAVTAVSSATRHPRHVARLWRSPSAKYLGALGIALPLLFTVYYTYIESWTLSYAYFSARGSYMVVSTEEMRREVPSAISGVTPDSDHDDAGRAGCGSRQPAVSRRMERSGGRLWATGRKSDTQLDPQKLQRVLNPLARAHTNQFLQEYQGVSPPGDRRFFEGLGPALGFWLLTVALNTWIISRGISEVSRNWPRWPCPCCSCLPCVGGVCLDMGDSRSDQARPVGVGWLELHLATPIRGPRRLQRVAGGGADFLYTLDSAQAIRVLCELHATER